MVSDATAYERGVNISQTGLIPNFREGVQANPWFQLGYQMGLKHGARAAGMMSRAKSEFPAVAARLQASRPGAPDTFAVEDRFYFGKGRKERFAENVTYSVAAMIGSDPVGHRSVRSVEEAKAYAKQMLESFKSQAKGKPVLVEVYPVVNTEPKDAILVLRG